MAQRVQVLLVDDVDGGDAAETVTFGLDGATYEIDLSSANADRLRDGLSTWIGHARRSSGGGRRTTRRAAASRRSNLNDVREWGRSNGFKVSDRGRVSADLQAAYDKANG